MAILFYGITKNDVVASAKSQTQIDCKVTILSATPLILLECSFDLFLM